MTSPVDTTVKFFHSDMVGAPVLTGAAGSLIAILDACLVNGFASKTLTGLVVSGGVATASFAGTFPGTAESVALIAGVTGALTALNGEQKITATGANAFSFATAAANGTATGTITALMAPAGWAVAFTGTNLRAYRSLDVGSNRFYLRVNDTGTMDARVVGYETMTAISTGTNLFPTAAQVSGGGYWAKSYVAGAEPIPWAVFANSKRFLIGMAYGASTGYGGPNYTILALHGFGDFSSWKSTADAYACMLCSQLGPVTSGQNFGSVSISPANSLSIARSHTGTAGAVAGELVAAFAGSGSDSGFSPIWGELPGLGGALILTQPVLANALGTAGPRGVMKELYHTPQGLTQAMNIRRYDLVPGVGVAAGRKLMAIAAGGAPGDPTSGAYYPATFIDITGPWE
jgi:hypothetical protein